MAVIVVDPAAPAVPAIVTAHFNDDVPQPVLALIALLATTVALLLLNDTRSGSVPVSVSDSALNAEPWVTDWLVPPEIVGGAGFVTVTENVVAAMRFAPSFTSIVTLATPVPPTAGVTVRSQLYVPLPHPVGDTVTLPLATLTSVVLSEDPVSVSVPTPARVTGMGLELCPPTTIILLIGVIVGAGIALSAPITSTRPYPNTPSGTVLPN